jgi:hypothetical protein
MWIIIVLLNKHRVAQSEIKNRKLYLCLNCDTWIKFKSNERDWKPKLKMKKRKRVEEKEDQWMCNLGTLFVGLSTHN